MPANDNNQHETLHQFADGSFAFQSLDGIVDRYPVPSIPSEQPDAVVDKLNSQWGRV